MRRGEEFFRIRSGLAFEACCESVRVGFQRAALGADRTDAVLEPAFPRGGTAAIDLHGLLLLDDFG
jgi:hypothetical protein